MLKVARNNSNQYVFPVALTGAAVLLIVAAIVLFSKFGSTALFALTGKPFNLHGNAVATAHAENLPHVTLSGSVSNKQISVGDTQTITISATSDQDTRATIKAWITSPHNKKQVWKSPKDVLTTFQAGKTVTKNYEYQVQAVIPKTKLHPAYVLPPGVYKLSAIITSADGYSDYVVNENITEFTLQ